VDDNLSNLLTQFRSLLDEGLNIGEEWSETFLVEVVDCLRGKVWSSVNETLKKGAVSFIKDLRSKLVEELRCLL
jgi:hypothetical protein